MDVAEVAGDILGRYGVGAWKRPECICGDNSMHQRPASR